MTRVLVPLPSCVTISPGCATWNSGCDFFFELKLVVGFFAAAFPKELKELVAEEDDGEEDDEEDDDEEEEEEE